MKDQVVSVQIGLTCRDLERSIDFFTSRLGFRLDMIAPADDPSTAVVSGHGATLRLERSENLADSTLRLIGNFAAELEREIFSPDGLKVVLIDPENSVEFPKARQEFSITKFDGKTSWQRGRAGMLYRDLIPTRLGGAFVASHISIPDGGTVPDYVHFHKIRFQTIFCLKGWARLVYEDQGDPFLMNAGDCVLQPPEIRHRVLETSDNFEVLEVGSPAIHPTFVDHELKLPNDKIDKDRSFSGQWFHHFISAGKEWRTSNIKNVEEIDTGISESSGGKADIRILRSTGQISYPVRESSELFFVFLLDGDLEIADGAVTRNLSKNDCAVLPKGQEFRFNLDKDAWFRQITVFDDEA